MSHLALQSNGSPSDSRLHHSNTLPGQNLDSPTTGKAQLTYRPIAHAAPSLPPLAISTLDARSKQPPHHSPRPTSSTVSPPSSASPKQSRFASSILDSFPVTVNRSPGEPLRFSPSPEDTSEQSFVSEGRYHKEDPSPPPTPTRAPRTPESRPGPPPPNDTSSAPYPIVRKPSGGSAASTPAAMAGGPGSSRADATKPPARTASIDSAASTLSSKTSQDPLAGASDVANLVKAAGSPEAVIQYLLKEKQSQAQQNAQLWRLVDKQRAMILGLNKDLERALKEKEKYRRKMKEVVSAHDDRAKNEPMPSTAVVVPRVELEGPKDQVEDVPASPSNLDSDSVKHSPIDMSMAPYPITPPADQVSNGPPSAVGELLDPSHAMPRPSEHALDNFDHEEDDRAAGEAIKANGPSNDLPFSLALPPSRALPSEPPRMPPPKPPVPHPSANSMRDGATAMDMSNMQFPPPSAPPPRKPPPAPLQLKKETIPAAAILLEDDNESDSDYDSLLEVTDIPTTDKRGRRRTREEDEEEREMLAQQEAERRSLSKKSKKGSQKGTPKEVDAEFSHDATPPSPRTVNVQPALMRDHIPSLAGVLSGQERQTTLMAPLMSPGLPASPRPVGLKSAVSSPPLSPMGMPSAPLSPRAPRQPIPLPPNTPMLSPPAGEPLVLTSPKPLNIRKASESNPVQPSPPANRDSPSERTRIYKGFITDEFPELLLPPNALLSIEVRVASSRMKPSRASLISLTQLEEDPVFTLAVFSRSERGELWRVEKDTASLAKLDQRLKQCPAFTARTPDRSLFNGHAPAKLDARRIALNQYMDELLNTPLDVATALELCKYLSTHVLPPNSDDTGSVIETGSETSSQRAGPGGRPFKSGYLTKRGKNFGGWKARYFVLDGPLLRYYETPGGAHLGTIKLQNAQIGKQSQHNGEGSPTRGPNGDELDNQYRHAFLVMEPKKKDSNSHVKHVLCAESDRERDQWVDALLRWIDYKDTEDEDSHSGAMHDRHGSTGSGHINGLNAKKKMYGQGRPPPSRTSSQDGLIGISYEGTKQGSVPDGVASRRRMETPDSQERAAAPSYTISAPRDPQVISDSTSWGANMKGASLGLPGPSLDEKKARKRSFFGFGPKARSSDDQDVLFGSGAGGPGPGTDYRGQPRQVFGAPLAEAVRYHGPTDVSVPLPAVVFRCIQYLDAKKAFEEEGIFRLSGSNVVIKQLRERFNNESDIDLLTDATYYDMHAVASLLKLYLRELPTTILTRDLHNQFAAVAEMPAAPEKIAALSELVQHLPQANGTLLRYLLSFLLKIINNSDKNKMTVRNVGIVFSPTLNIPAPVFALLLQNYQAAFGISPEEYELPSPVSDTESRPSTEPQTRRPSTGTMDSPHRQRLQEMNNQRSTPTPPPAMVNPAARATATPPPGMSASAARHTGYEPQYLAQQQGNSNVSLRPAYETGMGMPPTYDPTGLQASSRGMPAYDRPHYQSSTYEQDYNQGPPAAYDQPYTAKSKRRESSMFMGNMMPLNSQASNSRLRDQNHM